MADQINFLNDPHRRYKIMWISQVELDHGRNRFQVLTYLNERLGSCEPGTTIARIFYDNARQSQGIVLYNDKWPATIEGEELRTYIPPTRQEPHIIDVEFSVDKPKELEGNGKTT